MNDLSHMKRAIELGKQARVHAPPNPWVGSVVIQNEKVVGEGCSEKAGGAHAEVIALRIAKEKAKGASLYVSLEPCSHHGKTPPCTKTIIESGVEKVFIAVEDPDPKVSGSGIKQLKEAGIEVNVGLLEQEARYSLAPYLHHRKTGRAFCVAKAAISIDGSLAAIDHSSKWITGKEARVDVHRQRAESQAIIIGSATAMKDDPLLTVRGVEPPPSPPLRIILDSKNRIPGTLRLLNTKELPTLVIKEPIKNGHVDLRKTLEMLGEKGVIQAFFEGGPRLISALLNEGLIDQLSIYIGPKILGSSPHKLFSEVHIPSIEKAKNLKLLDLKKLGDSVRMDYQLC